MGYAAIGGDNLLLLKLGCLVKATRRFEVFQELNLCNIDDRVTLLRTWVLLIPIIKGIVECIQQRRENQPSLLRDFHRRIGNVMVSEMTKSVIGVNRTATFMKTWTFIKGVDITAFYNNQRAILNVLSGTENGFLKELPGEDEKLRISTELDYKVSCLFRLFCYPVPTILLLLQFVTGSFNFAILLNSFTITI